MKAVAAVAQVALVAASFLYVAIQIRLAIGVATRTRTWSSSSSGNTRNEPRNSNSRDKALLAGATTSDFSERQRQQQRRQPLPPFSSLVENGQVVGNVSSLLDFAVVGYPKCATTMLLHWLRQQPEVLMPPEELHIDKGGKLVVEAVRALYDLSPPPQPPSSDGTTAATAVLRGYKNPADVFKPKTLQAISRHFPGAGLVVGVRHPVAWFESFYNYRMYKNNFTIATSLVPAPEDLIGECLLYMGADEKRELAKRKGWGDDAVREFGLVCTDLARFHVNLSALGKTNPSSTPEERSLLLGSGNDSTKKGRRNNIINNKLRKPLKNKVFLYDTSQMNDSDEIRQDAFRRDLSNFLGLKNPIVPPKKTTTTKGGTSSSLGTADDKPLVAVDDNANPRRKYPLDICDPRYEATLRAELLRNARDASAWIRRYFMDHPDVTVSSPDFFREQLLLWEKDPCTDAAAGIQSS